MFCRSTIFNLRKQTDSDVKALGAMKTRHLDAQTEAQNLKGQVAQLRTEKSALESKCASYKVSTNELVSKLNGATSQRSRSGSSSSVRAATTSNVNQTEMQNEWTEIIETASTAPPPRSRTSSNTSKR